MTDEQLPSQEAKKGADKKRYVEMLKKAARVARVALIPLYLTALLAGRPATPAEAQNVAPDVPKPLIQEGPVMPAEDMNILVLSLDGGGMLIQDYIGTLTKSVVDLVGQQGIGNDRTKVVTYKELPLSDPNTTQIVYENSENPIDTVLQEITNSVSQSDRELTFILIGHHYTRPDLTEDEYELIVGSDGISTPDIADAIAKGLVNRSATAPELTLRVFIEACHSGVVVLPNKIDKNGGNTMQTPLTLYDNVRARLAAMGHPDMPFHIQATAASQHNRPSIAVPDHTAIDKVVETVVAGGSYEKGASSVRYDNYALQNIPQIQGDDNMAVVGDIPPSEVDKQRSGLYAQSTTFAQSLEIHDISFQADSTTYHIKVPVEISNYQSSETGPITVTLVDASPPLSASVGQPIEVVSLGSQLHKEIFLRFPIITGTQPYTGVLTIGIGDSLQQVYFDSRTQDNSPISLSHEKLISPSFTVFLKAQYSLQSFYAPVIRITQPLESDIFVRVAALANQDNYLRNSIFDHQIYVEQTINATLDNPIYIQLNTSIYGPDILRGKVKIYGAAGNELLESDISGMGDNNNTFDLADKIPTETGKMYSNDIFGNTMYGYDTDMYPIPKDGKTKAVVFSSFSYHDYTIPPNSKLVFYDQERNILKEYISANQQPQLTSVIVDIPDGTAYVGVSTDGLYNGGNQFKYLLSFVEGHTVFVPVVSQN